MNNEMKNLVSVPKNGNVEVCLKDAKYYYVPFNKLEVDFMDPKIRDKFIKSVEQSVRSSKLYKAYIAHLKDDLGLTKCAIYGNIESTNDKKRKTKIEMHHGPIFTLYDYVNIVLEKKLRTQRYDELNSFDIKKEVLDLHRFRLVQTTMLCESVHKSITKNAKKAPFIRFNESFGFINEFVKKYHEYFLLEHVTKIRKYIEESKLYDGTLGEIFKPTLVKYNIVLKKE